MGRWKVAAAFTVAGAIALTAVTNFAFALNSGDSVVILLPADSNQPEPPSGPTDRLVYTGGKVTAAPITGCGTGDFPIQNGVLVDPAGGRSGRIVGLITISGTTAVPPATKLKDLTLVTSCTIGGTNYNRYTAVVE